MSLSCKAVCFVFVITACNVFTSANDLQIEYLDKPDCQRKTKKGDYLRVHYTGTLAATGEKFDSSVDRGTPFEFELGNNEVIIGWDQGMKDMCIGEKRRLTVPPHLGYGETGAGEVIPGGATLVFEVELVGIDEAPKPNNVFTDIDKDGDNMLSQDEVSDFVRQQEEANSITQQDDFDHEKMIADVFEHEDTDRDGFISLEEFQGPKKDEL